jgi:hypothetical protein
LFVAKPELTSAHSARREPASRAIPGFLSGSVNGVVGSNGEFDQAVVCDRQRPSSTAKQGMQMMQWCEEVM